MSRINPKRAAFVREYLKDHNAAQAAIRAGYSQKTARQIGSQLLTNLNVRQALAEAEARIAEKAETSQAWVLSRLRENVERSMQVVPVYDRDGNETGQYQYEGAVANRALELIGKHRGMFSERSLSLDLSKLSEPQLQRIINGEDPLHVLAASGSS